MSYKVEWVDYNGKLIPRDKYMMLKEIDKRDKIIMELLHERNIKHDNEGIKGDN